MRRYNKQEKLLASAALGIVYVSAGWGVLSGIPVLNCYRLAPGLLEF